MVRLTPSTLVLGFVLLFLVVDLLRHTLHQSTSLRPAAPAPATQASVDPAAVDDGDAGAAADGGGEDGEEADEEVAPAGAGAIDADAAPVSLVVPSPEPIKDFIISEDLDAFEDATKPGEDGVVITAGEGGVYGEEATEGSGTEGAMDAWQREDKPEFFAAPVPLGAGIVLQRQVRNKLKAALACWDNRADFEPGERKGRWLLDRNAGARQEKTTVRYYVGDRAPSYDLNRVASLPLKPYSWDPPPKCEVPLRPWSRAGMCQVLRGKRVLLLGDELQGGWLDTLADLLGKQPVRHGHTADPRCPHRLRPDGGCLGKEYAVCEGTVRLAYRRNDQLQFRGDGVGTQWSLAADSVAALKAQPRYRGLGPNNSTSTVALPINDVLHQPNDGRYDVIVLSHGWTAPLTPSYKVTAALNESLAILRSWPGHLESHFGIEPWQAAEGAADRPPAPVKPAAVVWEAGGKGSDRRGRRRKRSRRGRKLLQLPPSAGGGVDIHGRRLAGGDKAGGAPRPPKAYSQPLIIYREAIPPGLHRHCSVADPVSGTPSRQQPLDTPPRALLPGVSGCGTACDAREQSLRIHRLLARYHPGVLHMPVAVSTSMRPDAHVDAGRCELYGGLGPYDHWSRLLFNTLRFAAAHNEFWDE